MGGSTTAVHSGTHKLQALIFTFHCLHENFSLVVPHHLLNQQQYHTYANKQDQEQL
jgi:hypothetical protein